MWDEGSGDIIRRGEAWLHGERTRFEAAPSEERREGGTPVRTKLSGVKKWLFGGLTAALVALSNPLAASCAEYGTIQGVLVDAKTGAPLRGIAVSVGGPWFAAETVTDSHGLFSFLGVYAAPHYTMAFEGPGVSEVRNGLTVFCGQITNVGRIAIRPGSMTGAGTVHPPIVPVFNLSETIDSYSVTTTPPYTGKPGI